MKIYTDAPEGTTVVQNAFIDRFMPHASGEFVKVYLYLLRCADTGQELSLASIADIFDHTEKDVRRALAYWEKQKLLRLKLSPDGTFASVTFLTPPAEERRSVSVGSEGSGDAQDAVRPDGIVPTPRELSAVPGDFSTTPREFSAAPGDPPAASGKSPAAPALKIEDKPSRARIRELSGQADIRQLFFIAEQYLGRPLTPSEQSDLIYYYDTLHFSTDLIDYLLDYCISKGSKSRRYIRTVALGWAQAGIATVAQAQQETNLYNKNFYTVLNAFGIRNRGPAASEQEIMSRWFTERGFSIELVLEACRRTIRQTHQPSFEYADSILETWYKNRVVSLRDVEQLDAQRKQEQKKTADRPSAQTTGKRMNNFPQRTYDFKQLEKKLLNQQTGTHSGE